MIEGTNNKLAPVSLSSWKTGNHIRFEGPFTRKDQMPSVRYMNTIGLNSMKRKQFKSTKHQKQAMTTKHIGLQSHASKERTGTQGVHWNLYNIDFLWTVIKTADLCEYLNVLKYKLIHGLKFGTCHILTFSVHFLTICDHICRRFQIRRTIHSERLPRYEEATGEDLFWSFSWHWWPQANHPRQGLLRHAFIKQKQ